jgi:hypothetical protein
MPRAKLYKRVQGQYVVALPAHLPYRLNALSSVAIGNRCKSLTVLIPNALSRSSVTLPTPGTRLTGNGNRNASTRSG